MFLKILKLLTLICYCLIPFVGPKLAFFMIVIIIFYLISQDPFYIIYSLTLLTSMSIMLLTIFGLFKKYEFKIFLLGGMILSIPIWQRIVFNFNGYNQSSDVGFYIVSAIYFALLTSLLIRLRKKQISNKSNLDPLL
jgi:hypothetical protein